MITALDIAAIAVSTQVDERIEKLLYQVTVGTVQLNAVETSIQCELRRRHILLHSAGNIDLGHRTRHAVSLHSQRVGVHLSRTNLRTRSNYLGAGWKVCDMRHPTAMHQLHEDLATPCMHGGRRNWPSAYLAYAERSHGFVSSAPSLCDWQVAASERRIYRIASNRFL